MHCSLWLYFMIFYIHRWLHKCLITKESITRPTWPHLFSLFLDFLEKSFYFYYYHYRKELITLSILSYQYHMNEKKMILTKKKKLLSKQSRNGVNNRSGRSSNWLHGDLRACEAMCKNKWINYQIDRKKYIMDSTCTKSPCIKRLTSHESDIVQSLRHSTYN